MGNCISSEDTSYYYKPLLVNKDAEIESLNTYIANLQLQLNYFSTHKDDIHSKYYDLLEYQRKISNENNYLKDILKKNNIPYNVSYNIAD